MTDYASELFDEPVVEETKSLIDYASDLFGDETEQDVEVQRHFKETGATDVRGFKPQPIKEFTGEGGAGASFKAHVKSGFVDDPITKMKIFAADRFPDLPEEERMSRYRYQKGEFIFKADDGKWYSESPDLGLYKAKRFFGETTAHSPSIVLGTIGATAGPLHAIAGAMGGEGYRKVVGALAFDEPQATFGNVLDMVQEGALALAGETMGFLFKGAARRGLALTGGRKGMRVAAAAGPDLPKIDFKKAAVLQKKTREKFGIELFDGQTTESRRLLDKINLYGDLPSTADIVQSAKRIQDEQAYKAVERFWDDIYPPEDALVVGSKIQKAAQKSIDREIAKRSAKAKPLYDKAFKAETQHNIIPHINHLDEMIEAWPLNSPQRAKLQKIRSMLFREVEHNGKVWKVPESRIKQLDRLKKAIDAELKPKVGEAPVNAELKRDIRQIKNNILEDVDKDNDFYRQARKAWADDTEVIERLTNKTKLKGLSDLEGDNVVNATRRLFSNTGNSPEIVTKVRNRIIREDPEAWRAALRTHLEGLYEATRQSGLGGADNSAKLFHGFYRRTIGDAKQKKLLAAAMGGEGSEQFKNFADFTDALRRVGLVARRESTTATRDYSLRQEVMKAASRPLYPVKRILIDKLNIFMTEKKMGLLAEALLDTRSRKHVLKIRRMGVNTEKGAMAAITFLSLVSGGEFRRHGLSILHREDKKH
jgi:hypothetical protein